MKTAIYGVPTRGTVKRARKRLDGEPAAVGFEEDLRAELFRG